MTRASAGVPPSTAPRSPPLASEKGLVALAWMGYRLAFAPAARRLLLHRERVLAAVTRD